MLGELITSGLALVLGYAYPAFQCFKTLEKNRVEIHELRFWCQYWVIVAVLTVIERIGDTFISWLPMYGEMKLALFIYMWYPKTKGSGYLYETLLRPCVTRHEPEIERNLREMGARVWDLALYYWQNCTELGQTAVLQIIDSFVGNYFTKSRIQKADEARHPTPTAPPLSFAPIFHRSANQHNQHSQAQFMQTQEEFEPDWTTSGSSSIDESATKVDHKRGAWFKLRRSNGYR